MEDLNALAADCVVICCCCQCLILQILVFSLLRLPAKLARRTVDFAKRKLDRRRRRRTSDSGIIGSYMEEIVRIEEEEFCVRVRAERNTGFEDDDEIEGHVRGENCIQEVEKVMMELYEKGEFGFGSFCGRRREGEDSGCSVAAINVSTTLKQIEVEEEDGDFVKYQIIQMGAGSFCKT